MATGRYLQSLTMLSALPALAFVLLLGAADAQECRVSLESNPVDQLRVAIFTCRCQGIIQDYVWRRIGGAQLVSGRHLSVVDGSGHGLLYLYRVQQSDAGTYECQGRSNVGVSRDRTVLLVRGQGPTAQLSASIQPSTVTRNQGASVVFECSAAPSSPNNRFTWSRSSGALPTRSFVLEGGNNLFLYSLQPADTGTYVCSVVAENGATASARASLTVPFGEPIPTAPAPRVTTRPPPPTTQLRTTRPPIRTFPPPAPTRPPPPQTLRFPVSVVPTSSIRRPGNASFMVCNYRLPPGYSVLNIQWSRVDGRRLPFQRTKQYTCNSVLYVHDLSLVDTGFYTCQVTAVSSITGQTAISEGIGNVRVVNLRVSITPPFHSTSVGEQITYQCNVNRDVSNEAQYQWTRMHGKGIPRTASTVGSRLTLRGLREEDTGEYCCSATVGSETSQSCAELLVGEGCIRKGEFMRKGAYGYFNTSEVLRNAQVRPAADIIMLIDESRSMIREHSWLQDISIGLDLALKANGIGVDIPNQFGLVGFAKDDPEAVRGRVFPMSECDGSLMGTAEEFNSARENLALDGREEDLYHAMELALDRYPLRPGQACQIIGITDEGRTPQDPYISYDRILQKMRAKGCMLNVVVNQKMQSTQPSLGTEALGVSSSNDSAVERPGGGYTIYRNAGRPVVQTAHGSTHVDYTRLAFELGGAAWDLNRLRDGGDTAVAFTKAFINLKVREISRQICERCFCDLGPRPDCRDGCLGEPPVVLIRGSKNVTFGSSVSLTCEYVGGDPIPRLRWQGPGNEPGVGLPPNSAVAPLGDFIQMRVDDVRSSFCVECNGSNLEGIAVELHCVDVLQEAPKVSITGTHANQPVTFGAQVTLECVATHGIPTPALQWQNRPQGSTFRSEGGSIFLTIPSLTQGLCVQCIGSSILGSDSAVECLTIQEVVPEVLITGSHLGAPNIVIGTALDLSCVSVVGIPMPTLVWEIEGRTVAGTTGESGNAITWSVPSLLERTCVTCVGSNSAGIGRQTVCVDVTGERPRIGISGSNNGAEVTFGEGVSLRCVPEGGVPFPQVSWGGNLPPGAVQTRDGNVAVLTLTNLLERTCVTCIGTNLIGDQRVTECINVGGEIPSVEIRGSDVGSEVVFGSSINLQCVAVGGRPDPQLSWENLPPGTLTGSSGSAITIRADSLPLGRNCFTCVGNNLAGTGRDEQCITVVGEPPVVQISGINVNRPILGTEVTLRCIEVSGLPRGQRSWVAGQNGRLPAGATQSTEGDAIVLRIPSIVENICISCISSNAVGTGRDEQCIDVTSERPRVQVTSSNTGPSVDLGSSVEFVCVQTQGIPTPQLSWRNPASGGLQSTRGAAIVVNFADLRQRACVTCVGTNLAGEGLDTKCVEVRSQDPKVEITGGRDVIIGSDIELRCRPVEGIPFPIASWSDKPPNGAILTRSGDAVVMSLSNVQQRTCVTCYGTSLAGRVAEETCFDVLSEPPVVSISGTNTGQPVPRGSGVTLSCTIQQGIPTPQLRWEVVGGGALPQNAITQQINANTITLQLPSFQEDLCVRCVGTNIIGSNTADECLELDEIPPVVRLTGSNQGQSVQQGDSVTLRCEPVDGNPNPTLTWEAPGSEQIPTTITRIGNALILELEQVLRDFCVICRGTNSAGSDTEEICVRVERDRPRISLIGSNKGQPLNEGGAVDLICIPIGGYPIPTVVFRTQSGQPLPPDAIVLPRGNGSIATIPSVSRYICVECVGTNSEGETVERICLDILSTCPHPRNTGERLFHGANTRRYSQEPGDIQINVPSSAVIAFVVDESGSMRGEHEWLRSTVEVFERNLQTRGIGVLRPNQYALVGFGHPDKNDPARERGKVLLGDASTSGCRDARSLRSALGTMFVDGRLEDGYSAAGVALEQIECLQFPRQPKTACQVILATDEGRDVLSSWRYQSMLDMLRRYDCVLNVVVWERMRGRLSEGADWQRALGVSETSGAVIARNNDEFIIVPEGRAFSDSGHEDTHEAYVKLAFDTGGAAWDLQMLRTERYRQSFTNGFIEVKVQEIIRQSRGVCEDCVCRNGSNVCQRYGRNFGESACLNPVPNANLGVTATPTRQLLEPGAQAEFTCDVRSSGNVSVTWYPQTPETLVRNNRLIITNVTETRDSGLYTCRAVNQEGYNEARIQLTVSAQPAEPDRPFQQLLPGEVIISTSQRTATANQEILALTCCVRRQPGDTIEWYYNSDSSGQLPRRAAMNSRGQLVFNPIRREHAGEYECVHKTSGGANFATARLAEVRGQVITLGLPTNCGA
eukprot:scpid12394/ scgid16927/ Hemicentin-1; Fibulin-6